MRPDILVLVIYGINLMSGCGGSSLPIVPTVERPPTQAPPVHVPTLPPPALAEEVPPQPWDQMLWVDGCWEPSGQNWVWIRGGWLVPPEDSLLFRGKAVVTDDGGFLWHPCTWVKDGKAMGWLDPAVPATSPLNGRTIYVPPS